jgi:uncharacterized NAD(P)/FAD-binding protein YdhS
MSSRGDTLRIAIIGGGPSGMYSLSEILKRLETKPAAADAQCTVHLYEKGKYWGAGMPYNPDWTNPEHMTNIDCGEVPAAVHVPHEWLLSQADEWHAERKINRNNLREDYLMTRTVMGEYLRAQMDALFEKCREQQVEVVLHIECEVTDVIPNDTATEFTVVDRKNSDAEKDTADDCHATVDHVVLATGHMWPVHYESEIQNYFDSPWPASKLEACKGLSVGLLGSSLSAVDVVVTLALMHGRFERSSTAAHEKKSVNKGDKPAASLRYVVNGPESDNFKITLHSRHGLLPNLRTYCDSGMYDTHRYVDEKTLEQHMASNEGFLSLDFIFDKGYREPMKELDSGLYAVIKDMSVEEFVKHVYRVRQKEGPFTLMRREYQESQRSLAEQKPIHWKDVLENLSYTIGFHAKHLSAEDMLRFRHYLMPLVSIIVASLPLEAAEKLLAMHDAGWLDIVRVGFQSHIEHDAERPGARVVYHDDRNVEKTLEYGAFVNCVGQERIDSTTFPFQSMVKAGVITEGTLPFRSHHKMKKVLKQMSLPDDDILPSDEYVAELDAHAVAIDDRFRPLDADGNANRRVTVLASSFLAGLVPDHPGLPYCQEIASTAADNIFTSLSAEEQTCLG